MRITCKLFWKYLKELKILKAQDIDKLEISVFMLKLHNDQLPKKLSDSFSANNQIHSYGTRHADDCHLPHKSTTLGQYSH